VAVRIKGAIAISGLAISTTVVGGVLTLTNLVITSRGDRTITNNVETGNFAVSGMSGSKGGDCGELKACTLDADCISGHCVIAAPVVVGTCSAPPPPLP
jgi:hypothetical protein